MKRGEFVRLITAVAIAIAFIYTGAARPRIGMRNRILNVLHVLNYFGVGGLEVSGVGVFLATIC